jgi:hypothetical protein
MLRKELREIEVCVKMQVSEVFGYMKSKDILCSCSLCHSYLVTEERGGCVFPLQQHPVPFGISPSKFSRLLERQLS